MAREKKEKKKRKASFFWNLKIEPKTLESVYGFLFYFILLAAITSSELNARLSETRYQKKKKGKERSSTVIIIRRAR